MILHTLNENSDLYKYLGKIRLDVGPYRKHFDGMPLYGCHVEDEKAFYQGILDLDKSYPRDDCMGFETLEEVEEFWLRGGDGACIYIKADELLAIEC